MSNSKRERQRAHREAQVAAAERAKRVLNEPKLDPVGSHRSCSGSGRSRGRWICSDDNDSPANSDQAASIGAQTLGLDGCPPVEGSSERRFQFDTPPKLCIDTGQLYAEFVTNVGDFTVVLDPTSDSLSNNLIFLARHGAYNGTIFHRVIDQFVSRAATLKV